ncbi:MAG: helix-turn-helix transcriptional regulator [Myxococcota bacterium]
MDDIEADGDVGAIIARRLKAARARAGLSQEALASAANLSVDVIRKLEQNRMSRLDLQTYSAIARVLKVETSWFTEARAEAERRAAAVRTFDVEFVHRTVELDFISADARTVRQKRTARLRAIKGGILSFVDQLSTDGKIEDIKVRPGTYEHKRTEGGEMFLQVNFVRPLAFNDEIDVSMQFNLVDSFPDLREEYWSVRVNHPTDLVRLVLRFHPDRPFKTYRGYERFTSHEELYGVQPEALTSSGSRPTIDWKIEHPSVGCVYKLSWSW